MKPLIILTGPTAVGKTELSINLAKKLNGEIISADSMQVYKGMDIGTAKITTKEMDGVPHHLIDILNPDEEFNVCIFKKYADAAINDIYSRGRVPIITGGTGFYIQSVLYDIQFDETEDNSKIRAELEEYANENGNEKLFELLRQCDPKSCEAIHPNNTKRVIRAIEYFRMTGKKISEHNEEQQMRPSPYNYLYFVLNDDREKLYNRIERRIDIMLEAGLLEEVKELYKKYPDRTLVSMQGLGYKEIIAYLEGECSLDEAISILKRDTRHFAKRQLTWFRREKEVIWLDKNSMSQEEILQYIDDLFQKMKGTN